MANLDLSKLGLGSVDPAKLDAKAIVEKLADKILGDKSLLSQFKTEPADVVNKLAGTKLPDNITDAVVSGIKAKIGADGVKGVLNSVKGLFGK